MNSDASQSSSSGCVGHSPWDPRSSSTFDRPAPKSSRHVRLTNVRAVSGLSCDTSQFARSRRVARAPFVSSRPRNKGIEGSTIGDVSSIQFARGRMRVTVGSVETVVTTCGIDASRRPRSVSSRCSSRLKSTSFGLEKIRYSCSAVRSASSRSSDGRRSAFITSSGSPLAHVVLPLGSLLRTRAPAPAIGGHANGSAASTSRKRPMDARRSSESCRSVTTIVESAVVLTGPANRSARNGFRASPKRMPHAVFGLPSIAASGGMLGSVVLDGTDGGVSFTVAMVNGILRAACPVSTSSASTSVRRNRSAPRA